MHGFVPTMTSQNASQETNSLKTGMQWPGLPSARPRKNGSLFFVICALLKIDILKENGLNSCQCVEIHLLRQKVFRGKNDFKLFFELEESIPLNKFSVCGQTVHRGKSRSRFFLDFYRQRRSVLEIKSMPLSTHEFITQV